MYHSTQILLLLPFSACCGFGQLPNAEISRCSVVDQPALVSKLTIEP